VKIDLIKLKIGMWIAFSPHNKTATEVMHEINSKVENTRRTKNVEKCRKSCRWSRSLRNLTNN
jgi:hypothetical protein